MYGQSLNEACLSVARFLKRGHAYRNLKTSLVGSSAKGYSCNRIRNNRVRLSWLDSRSAGGVVRRLGAG